MISFLTGAVCGFSNLPGAIAGSWICTVFVIYGFTLVVVALIRRAR